MKFPWTKDWVATGRVEWRVIATSPNGWTRERRFLQEVALVTGEYRWRVMPGLYHRGAITRIVPPSESWDEQR